MLPCSDITSQVSAAKSTQDCLGLYLYASLPTSSLRFVVSRECRWTADHYDPLSDCDVSPKARAALVNKVRVVRDAAPLESRSYEPGEMP